MDKIVIFGYSGCGKSTLARQLGEILDIVPTHMDAIHWLPNWVENTPENKRAAIARVLENDRWIIDGNYGGTLFKERLDSADTVIFLDFNRFLCLYRVIKRRIMYSGKTRPDMGEGCKEKLDFEFIKWVLRDGRKKRKMNYEVINFLRSNTDKNVYAFKHPKELERFLENVR